MPFSIIFYSHWDYSSRTLDPGLPVVAKSEVRGNMRETNKAEPNQGSVLISFFIIRQKLLQVKHLHILNSHDKKVSEYDQEIPQSQTADKSMAPRERATQYNNHERSERQT